MDPAGRAVRQGRLVAWLVALAQNDVDAAVVVAWLLLPGATRLANSLRDLSPNIDVLVAGQLWLEVRSIPSAAGRFVAPTILRAVRRGVELGIGEYGRRCDPTWSHTVHWEEPNISTLPARDKEAEADPAAVAGFVVQAAVLDGAVTYDEVCLLESLALGADERRAPLRRGRAGLTAPSVVDDALRHRSISSRTGRRRAAEILDRLAAYVRQNGVLEDMREWSTIHDLPSLELAEFLELYFFDHLDEYAAEFRDIA